MGAAHSRTRPGVGPAKILKSKHGGSNGDSGNKDSSAGYFILCIKSNDCKIKVANASDAVIKMVAAIIKRHFDIHKAGWDRSSYAFKLVQKQSPTNAHGKKSSMLQLTAELLLSLYKSGWEPMTPIDLSVKGKNSAQNNNQTAICFRREGLGEGGDGGTPLSCSFEDLMSHQQQNGENKDCLCLETHSKNVLGFHNVPNTVLFDLVQCVRHEWPPGVAGISNAVSSVISDYAVDTDFDILPGGIDDRRYLRVHGRPWSESEEGADLEDAICAENLVIGIVACLARAQYKLQVSIQMDRGTTVFFFIRDQGLREVRLPTFCGGGLGEKNGMYVYRPTITRTKTSFFRSR